MLKRRYFACILGTPHQNAEAETADASAAPTATGPVCAPAANSPSAGAGLTAPAAAEPSAHHGHGPEAWSPADGHHRGQPPGGPARKCQFLFVFQVLTQLLCLLGCVSRVTGVSVRWDLFPKNLVPLGQRTGLTTCGALTQQQLPEAIQASASFSGPERGWVEREQGEVQPAWRPCAAEGACGDQGLRGWSRGRCACTP